MKGKDKFLWGAIAFWNPCLWGIFSKFMRKTVLWKKKPMPGFQKYLHPNRPIFLFHFLWSVFLCGDLRDVCAPKPRHQSGFCVQGVCFNAACRSGGAAHERILACAHPGLALGFLWNPCCSQKPSKSLGSCKKTWAWLCPCGFSNTGCRLLQVALDPVWEACSVYNPLEINIFVCSSIWQHLPGRNSVCFHLDHRFLDSCVQC